ncbi:PDZ domain-containing protein [Rhodopirellula sp. SWK7]|uniref:PDZ domain-containing protein n=1 Tax=Rhodopirellula sp. SWK7 TaxID=595460 RepID=UPI0002BDF683|nr:PDZ domain-containing protein [Rhodopirellula sp. SWK7]EMI45526.1 protease ecfE [Rhodopirellula sp. SWK7]
MTRHPLTRLFGFLAVTWMLAVPSMAPADEAVDGGVPSAPDVRQPEWNVKTFAPPGDANGGFVEPKERPGGHGHFGGWYLGVYGHYTDTGHLLTQVYANTAAARAGLEPGDRIVSVNGQQVGYVFGRRYPIDMLLQRHASHDGWVRLLVQDRRTMRLVNRNVRLTRGQIHF